MAPTIQYGSRVYRYKPKNNWKEYWLSLDSNGVLNWKRKDAFLPLATVRLTDIVEKIKIGEAWRETVEKETSNGGDRSMSRPFFFSIPIGSSRTAVKFAVMHGGDLELWLAAFARGVGATPIYRAIKARHAGEIALSRGMTVEAVEELLDYKSSVAFYRSVWKEFLEGRHGKPPSNTAFIEERVFSNSHDQWHAQPRKVSTNGTDTSHNGLNGDSKATDNKENHTPEIHSYGGATPKSTVNGTTSKPPANVSEPKSTGENGTGGIVAKSTANHGSEIVSKQTSNGVRFKPTVTDGTVSNPTANGAASKPVTDGIAFVENGRMTTVPLGKQNGASGHTVDLAAVGSTIHTTDTEDKKHPKDSNGVLHDQSMPSSTAVGKARLELISDSVTEPSGGFAAKNPKSFITVIRLDHYPNQCTDSSSCVTRL